MSSDIAIRVENLGKRYVIGRETPPATTFGGRVCRTLASPFSWLTSQLRGPSEEEILWALRDVSFEVRRGEVLGVIGRNGAGKSTLLKILSRITEPTTGHAEMHGRIGALLEVGTGMHPELTGRENIYLNGTIIGMRKAEIDARFDEIVDFSGIERFLDTPVKRYSSGMRVRLGFAIAAHLEPEVLIVDEVLAVGDAEFQKKCLGKMKDVAGHGRTVLFVSHNMGAVLNLCSRAILLESARMVMDSDVNSTVALYLSDGMATSCMGEAIWSEDDAPSCAELALLGIRVLGPCGEVRPQYRARDPIDIEVRFRVKQEVGNFRTVLTFLTDTGVVAFSSTNEHLLSGSPLPEGEYKTTCRLPENLLNGGAYTLGVHFGMPGVKVMIEGRDFLKFTVDVFGRRGALQQEKHPGVVAPELEWTLGKSL